MDMLPVSLWHRVFRCLLLPPGSSHPDNPLLRGRRKTPWYLTATMQPPAGRNLPVKFVDPDFTAAGQHRKNVKTYGSGNRHISQPSSFHILSSIPTHPSLQAQHPISLVYNNLHPQWERSVTSFRSRFRSEFKRPSGASLLLPSLSAPQAQHPIALVYNNLHPQWEKGVAFQSEILSASFPSHSQPPLCRPSTPFLWSTTTCTRSGRGASPPLDRASVPTFQCSLLPSLSDPQAQHPISLVYNNLHPQWERSVAFFLRHRGLRSLALTFTHVMQLDTIVSQDEWAFASLTSLTLKLRGCVDYSQLFDREHGDGRAVEQYHRDLIEQDHWTQYFGCPRVQRLKLGRGKWVLSDGWAGELKALRSLILKHVDWSHVDFKYVATLTPQLTEFTLYEGWDLDNPSVVPRGSGINRFCFDLSSARVLRFYFAQSTLTLFLTLSRSLKAFSAVAKRLVLSCKSTLPLDLHHLSLYGQERLVISSLRLASARVAYLNGPPSDWHSRDDAVSSISSQNIDSSSWATPAPPPYWHSLHRRSSPEFSWVEWLGAIARTVEELIVRHRVPVGQVGVEWGCLRSLGIVVESEERFGRDLDFERRRDDGEEEVTVEEFQERNQRQRVLQQLQQPHWRQEEQEEEEEEEQAGKLPLIKAPNLRAIFFPTRTCEQHTLASLRTSCPSLALYCIASRSFYWEKHGKELAGAPVVHVRKGRSGVSSNCFGARQAKNVREKMHSVNRELVEGYSVDKDEAYMLKYKGSLWRTYCSFFL
ncbi:unnamed protein product [Closterium sp. Naga37s-1]|nr:unnamed protein product [Closterium sp. Naga37s-1]